MGKHREPQREGVSPFLRQPHFARAAVFGIVDVLHHAILDEGSKRLADSLFRYIGEPGELAGTDPREIQIGHQPHQRWSCEYTSGAPVDLGVRQGVEQPRTREESVTETVVLCLAEPRAVVLGTGRRKKRRLR